MLLAKGKTVKVPASFQIAQMVCSVLTLLLFVGIALFNITYQVVQHPAFVRHCSCLSLRGACCCSNRLFTRRRDIPCARSVGVSGDAGQYVRACKQHDGVADRDIKREPRFR
jgi:hypothetical protein